MIIDDLSCGYLKRGTILSSPCYLDFVNKVFDAISLNIEVCIELILFLLVGRFP